MSAWILVPLAALVGGYGLLFVVYVALDALYMSGRIR